MSMVRHPSPEYTDLSDLRRALTERRVTALELTRQSLQRAETIGARLNAFVSLFPEQALSSAAAVDAAMASGRPLGPLAGIPIALKDNICLSWGRTTAGSRLLENYRSPYTATAAQRLVDAGAVVIGKTNLDEFAMGGSGENSAFGPTRNPWDESRVPGGSSSGSAAAVAAGVVPCALGSDTGGSIRQPAGMCGISGIKPTYGRVSRSGLIAYASSLDQIGPLARSVADLALLCSVICGHDALDSTSANLPAEDFGAELHEHMNGVTLGVPRQARSEANSAGVSAALENAAAVFREQGARVVEIDLPHIDHGIAAYYIIAPAEASSNLARFDGVRYGRRAAPAAGEGLLELYCRSRSEGLGAEVQRRIMLGTHALSSGYIDAYYTTALKVRRLIKQDYDRAFASGCTAILMPASPGPAFRLGSKSADPLAMYLEDVYTVGVNLAGLPGLTVPAGFETVTSDGVTRELPIGMQLIGPALGERTLLRLGAMFQRQTDWHQRVPVLN